MFNKAQIDRIRIQALNTLRPSLEGKRRHRDLALALLYYDTPVDIACMWLMHCIRTMRTHLDRFPDAMQSVKNVWEQYVAHPWRTFGPIHSIMKAADLSGLEATEDMKIKTSETFAFAPLTHDIQKSCC